MNRESDLLEPSQRQGSWSPVVIGLDIGSSGCRALALSKSGETLAKSRRTYPAQVALKNHHELEVAIVVRHVEACLAEVLSVFGDYLPPLCVAIASVGGCVVLLDKHGAPVGPALLTRDARGRDLFNGFLERGGREQVESLTGMKPAAHYSVSRMMWQHYLASDISSCTFVDLGGALAAAWGLPPVQDYSNAAQTLLFDRHARAWSRELLRAAHIPRRCMPTLVAPGMEIGVLPADVQKRLNIGYDDVPLVLAGFDQACAATGAGLEPGGKGVAGLTVGTSAGFIVPLEARDNGRAAGLWPVVPHVERDQEVAVAGTPAGGRAIVWGASTLAFCPDLPEAKGIGPTSRQAHQPIGDLLEYALERGTEVLALPHFGGSRTAFADPGSRATIFGMGFDTSSREVLRALVDGLAYELRALADAMLAAGYGFTRLRATGMGSTSAAWMQLMSDALELPIETLDEPDASAAGAAIAGHLCCYANEQTVHKPIRVRGVSSVFVPRGSWRSYHRRRYDQFKALHQALKSDTFRQVLELGGSALREGAEDNRR